MKRLYLLRHAKSDWADPDRVDADRPLSPRGRRAAPALGRYMRRERLIPAFALSSLKTIQGVSDKSESVVIVGHNPGLQALALELVGGGEMAARTRLATKFPTGGLAVFDFPVEHWADIGAGMGKLDRFVVPRDLD